MSRCDICGKWDEVKLSIHFKEYSCSVCHKWIADLFSVWSWEWKRK